MDYSRWFSRFGYKIGIYKVFLISFRLATGKNAYGFFFIKWPFYSFGLLCWLFATKTSSMFACQLLLCQYFRNDTPRLTSLMVARLISMISITFFIYAKKKKKKQSKIYGNFFLKFFLYQRSIEIHWHAKHMEQSRTNKEMIL